MQNFNYSLLELGEVNSIVEQSFSALPNDQYIKDNFNYRKRRYSSGRFQGGKMVWDSGVKFKQDKNLNAYLGGVARQYPGLEEEVLGFLYDKAILALTDTIQLNAAKVGVHQIRITASEQYMGKPAPEGIHQDGFDFVCVYCIQKKNTAGGDSLLLKKAPDNNFDVVFSEILNPGQVLLFNDRTYHHYVSPITPYIPGDANRDVFVFTFTKE